MSIGVANPKAQGQAINCIDNAFIIAKVMAGSRLNTVPTAKVRRGKRMTAGRK
jgi:hypothetical protein